MTIPNKREIIAVAVGLAFMFALGRYSAPSQSNTKATEDKHSDTKTEEAKDTHVVSHTVITKEPTGAVKTDTTTTTDVVVHEDTDTIVADKTTSETTQQKRSKINISAIVGTQIGSNFGQPIYGVSAQKQFIGPLTIGAFGLSNGTVGVSLGLDF